MLRPVQLHQQALLGLACMQNRQPLHMPCACWYGAATPCSEHARATTWCASRHICNSGEPEALLDSQLIILDRFAKANCASAAAAWQQCMVTAEQLFNYTPGKVRCMRLELQQFPACLGSLRKVQERVFLGSLGSKQASSHGSGAGAEQQEEQKGWRMHAAATCSCFECAHRMPRKTGRTSHRRVLQQQGRPAGTLLLRAAECCVPSSHLPGCGLCTGLAQAVQRGFKPGCLLGVGLPGLIYQEGFGLCCRYGAMSDGRLRQLCLANQRVGLRTGPSKGPRTLLNPAVQKGGRQLDRKPQAAGPEGLTPDDIDDITRVTTMVLASGQCHKACLGWLPSHTCEGRQHPAKLCKHI